MIQLITYDEYCSALDIANDGSEGFGWFNKCQKRALKMIHKCLAQSHLIPKNRYELAQLKPQYVDNVICGIAEQIRFIYENDIYFDNGYMNAASAFGVGGYNGGSMDRWNVSKIFNSLCPESYDEFENIGWTYASLTHRLSRWEFYNKNDDKHGKIWDTNDNWKDLDKWR